MADPASRETGQGDTTPPPPRENDHLAGHETAEAAIAEAVFRGQMHHAWLIQGPGGIGKATFAWRVAKYLHSLDGPENSADGGLFGDDLPANPPERLSIDSQDPRVRRVANGAHGDVRALSPAPMKSNANRLSREIKVEQVRDLIGFFQQTRSESAWRVAIIDAADNLNTSASNALLKLLEEPPERSVLLLVAHNPGRLLPTIRSRCRALSLRPLAPVAMRDVLQHVLGDLAEETVERLAALSDGAPGRAIRLRAAGGEDLYANMLSLLEGCPRPDRARLHKFAESLASPSAEEQFDIFRTLLEGWMMRLIRYASGDAKSPIPGEEGLMSRYASAAGVADWLTLWDKLRQKLDQAKGLNIDLKLAILAVFLEIDGTLSGA
ncbi:DNA polymerase III subunit delta' [Yunchengibacter salinarum]|uniref:DNA polymerase III subunit delta' n=1 Tax=Yunchengibacter salinarum TaxID=3133399 RepID=UPI0035B5FD4D